MSPDLNARRTVADLYFEIAGDQILGAQNLREVAFIADYLDDKGSDEKDAALIVMADGMVGRGARQIVASLVTSTFNKTFVRGYRDMAPAPLLLASLDKANTTLGETVRETPELAGMACTLVGTALIGDTLHWASVGDSHLYLLRDRQLRKLNDDHSYGGYLERLRADGVEVEADAEIAADMLMSAVNGDALNEVDCRDEAFKLRASDRLVIASPGINVLDNAAILDASNKSPNAKACVATLLAGVQADDNAGQANTTVIVIDVLGRGAGAASEKDPKIDGASTATTSAARSLPRRKSIVLDTLIAMATVLLFIGTAFGTWQGLGVVNEFRRGAGSSPAVPPTVAALPPAVPTSGSTPPGLNVGAPPAPGTASATSASGGGASSSLSFGAPAPLSTPSAPATAANALLPAAPMQTAAGEVFRDPLSAGGDGPLMVPIPAGQFQMGSNAHAQERPPRTVAVAAFAISRFEVTVEHYERFAGETGRKLPQVDALDGKLAPVTDVSWDDAYAYTRWLSTQTGKRYRLPSEAEWEYAASGGVASSYWWGPSAGEARAHCQDCKTGLDPRRATRVGRFDANPFTLFDTSGNVAEWVHDCWHPNYRDAPQDGNVWEGGDCTVRGVRGGSFSSTADGIRTQARAQHPSTQGASSIGFRVVQDM